MNAWRTARADWDACRDRVLSRGGPKVRELTKATDLFFSSSWCNTAVAGGWRPVHAFAMPPALVDGTIHRSTDDKLRARPSLVDVGVAVIIGSGAAHCILAIEGPTAVLLATPQFARHGARQIIFNVTRGHWKGAHPWWRLKAYRDDEGGPGGFRPRLPHL